jgi:hypothetical protein
MVSHEIEQIRKALLALKCSVNQFSKIIHWPQPRVAEFLRGAKQPGFYELSLFKQTVKRMESLQADVRADYGNVSICWTPSVWDVLESRHAKHDHSYSVGIRHSDATKEQSELDRLAETDRIAAKVAEIATAPTVLSGQGE